MDVWGWSCTYPIPPLWTIYDMSIYDTIYLWGSMDWVVLLYTCCISSKWKLFFDVLGLFCQGLHTHTDSVCLYQSGCVNKNLTLRIFEQYKNIFKKDLKLKNNYFKMIQFLTLFYSQETAVIEIWVDMTTFQISALFNERFYIASGFCWHCTLYVGAHFVPG